MALPKIVSLFSGAGGLDLGFYDTGYPIVLAVDNSSAAVKTHKRNFPTTASIMADLAQLGPTGVLDHLKDLLIPGERIGVIGGPPCQGFSRANTASVANDPRNELPLLYLEIVEALQARYDVQFVLFENVLGIRDAKHSTVFEGILSKFEQIGFAAKAEKFSALDYGVPQTRNRIIISGFSDQLTAAAFLPIPVIGKDMTVRSVIGALPAPTFYSRGLLATDIPHHENHWTMRPLSRRFSEQEHERRPSRCFRRLEWDKPSPTVAYGHREIHVHPDGRRRLSIYEAMLLQGFPSEFVLEGTLSAQVEQVSNAVPPPLARALADAIATAMSAARFKAGSGERRLTA
ncbi:DNA cytosine methyltransferase [Antrihabitans stalactiti]|uniref:DNA (cytosine-5-)-methyltransferase n=1 Tax=Antrihabitans stalactiti TaxID=2584121 RepID=A0A848KFR3_9NOCA|nr:DNA cytosine methyltransferase [Antrihabitans stalactiti]NMN97823.1 DNA cytosine methyltransferase [Antrihabitans stalactiti]